MTWQAWCCTVDGCGYLQPIAFGAPVCPHCDKPLTLLVLVERSS